MRYNLTLSPPKERIPRCADELVVLQVLTGHTGSVLCLQYDDKVIISGSSDSTVRVWDVVSGEVVNTLTHHSEAVLHLKFCNGVLVTCSRVSIEIPYFEDGFRSLFHSTLNRRAIAKRAPGLLTFPFSKLSQKFRQVREIVCTSWECEDHPEFCSISLHLTRLVIVTMTAFL